ncbi:MAG: PAN domain-containing protein [Caulobacterales bacterium]
MLTILRRPMAFVFALGLPLAVTAPALNAQENINRGGGDYTSFDQASADPGVCQAACRADGRCRAWTYVRPGVQAPAARCWLKSVVPDATNDACCVSGVNTPGAGSPLYMSRWDKVGGPGGDWSTGWVMNVPRQMCAANTGCACGGVNYCGEHQSGEVVPNWPAGCGTPQWLLRCTSQPQP